jgi:trehalose/maltose hydrolase-like predicted phosphorylase
VISQGGEAQRTPPQRSPQIGLHTGQVVPFGGDMERIDHHFGGLIRWQGRQQLTPNLPPALTRQQVVL